MRLIVIGFSVILLILLLNNGVRDACADEDDSRYNDWCDIYDCPFMTYLVEYSDYYKSGPYSEWKARAIIPAVILSDLWVITFSTYRISLRNDLKLQFGTPTDYQSPTYSDLRGIVKIARFGYLALIKLDEPLGVGENNTSGYKKAIKLPPSSGFTSQCKTANLSGWFPPYMNPKLKEGLKCYKGSRKDECSPEGTQVMTFPNNYSFCYEKNPNRVSKYYQRTGSALICGDDVLIGIVSNVENTSFAVEVGLYMTWIGEETGIKVPYQSAPPPILNTTTTTEGTTTEENEASPKNKPTIILFIVFMVVVFSTL